MMKFVMLRHWYSNQFDDRALIQMYWEDQQVANIPKVRCEIGWLWQ